MTAKGGHMEFDRIKFTGLRVDRRLSQHELATRLNVSRPTVAGWEQGTIIPRLSQINEAAAELGTAPEDLIIKEG